MKTSDLIGVLLNIPVWGIVMFFVHRMISTIDKTEETLLDASKKSEKDINEAFIKIRYLEQEVLRLRDKSTPK
jgi:hypothetical protein